MLKLEVNATYDVKLCNNSFILASDIFSPFGIEYNNDLISCLWWRPSGEKLTSAGNGLYIVLNELQCYDDEIAINGVYTCNLQSEGENLYIGIYRNVNNSKTD